MARGILGSILFLALLQSSGCASYPRAYSAESIEAWVVDADTGEALPGVVVVADWVLEAGSSLRRVGSLMTLETLTDENGRFAFPAWGPERVPYERRGVPPTARLTVADPRLIFFKSGYRAGGRENWLSMDALKGKGGSLRHSDWNGQKITLKRFEGDLTEYREHLESFGRITVESMFMDTIEACVENAIPRLIAALKREETQFGSAPTGRFRWSFETFMEPENCAGK